MFTGREPNHLSRCTEPFHKSNEVLVLGENHRLVPVSLVEDLLRIQGRPPHCLGFTVMRSVSFAMPSPLAQVTPVVGGGAAG
jgi:hypothetical protein